MLHPDHPNEKRGSLNFGDVQSKCLIFILFNKQCLHNF